MRAQRGVGTRPGPACVPSCTAIKLHSNQHRRSAHSSGLPRWEIELHGLARVQVVRRSLALPPAMRRPSIDVSAADGCSLFPAAETHQHPCRLRGANSVPCARSVHKEEYCSAQREARPAQIPATRRPAGEIASRQHAGGSVRGSAHPQTKVQADGCCALSTRKSTAHVAASLHSSSSS